MEKPANRKIAGLTFIISVAKKTSANVKMQVVSYWIIIDLGLLYKGK
ncbi:hypothetical protein [Pedobacter nutrimenti]|nr:hypothetical protein [Pedobacter nutrimenti]